MAPSQYLSKSLLVRLAPSNVGEQVHVNHSDCPAGIDTKKRLYVKRVEGGVLGYCHHCGLAGRVTDKTAEGTTLRKWLRGESSADLKIINKGLTYQQATEIYDACASNYFSVDASAWMLEYCMAPKEVHPVGDNIIYPLTDFHGNTFGYQKRMFDGSSSKYITDICTDRSGYGAWFRTHSGLNEKLLVITEDWFSAHKLKRAGNCDSLALLGTNLREFDKQRVVNNYTTIDHSIVVWLDDDDAGIKASLKIEQALKAVSSGVVQRRAKSREAKAVPIEELQAWIRTF